LLVAALLFSTGGAVIKATTFTGWQVASFRSLAASVAILLLVPAARRNWTWRVVLVGCAYAATLIMYVLANKLTTAANAIFLQSTAPLYLLLLGPWLLHETVHRSDLLLMAVVGLGMALFFVGGQVPLRTAPEPFSGNVIAVFSGVSWALAITGLRWIERKGEEAGSGMAMVVAGNLIAGFVCLPKAFPAAGAAAGDWFIVAYLGVFQIGLAYAFLTRAMRSVPALEASLLLLAEPALNPVWAGLVHGEWPGALAIAGGVLILSATLFRALNRREAVIE
jgi:DME family drug/metabolite transporter